MNKMMAITRKIPNRIFATVAAPAATPLKPRAPAMTEMTSAMMAHINRSTVQLQTIENTLATQMSTHSKQQSRFVHIACRSLIAVLVSLRSSFRREVGGKGAPDAAPPFRNC